MNFSWALGIVALAGLAAAGTGCAQSSCSLPFDRDDGTKANACIELQTTAELDDAEFSKYCSDGQGTFRSNACSRDDVIGSCVFPDQTTTDASGNKVIYNYEYFYYGADGITSDEAKGYCDKAMGTYYGGGTG
ncbi:MAG: hypothetical protein U0414_38535 [Polyangiaceae bacterium]